MYLKLLNKILAILLCCCFFITAKSAMAWDNTGGGDHGGADWTISSNTTIAGVHTNIGTFTVNTGITATIQSYNGSSFGNLDIQATTVNIQGNISGSGVGYRGVLGGNGEGPGGGRGQTNCALDAGGAGGANGARSGASSGSASNGFTNTAASGNFAAPVNMGSAGGSGSNGTCHAGGSGGGSVKITASGTLTVGGTGITVSGATGGDRGGAGSGGSIYLIAGTLAGAGAITANGAGASGYAAPGSGGRISLHYTAANTYSGTMSVAGGTNGNFGTTNAELGTIVIINDSVNDITIPTTQYWNSGPTLDGTNQVYRDISITNNSTLFLRGYYTNNSDGVGFNFTVRNFTINTGSSVNGTGGGYQGVAGANGAGPAGGVGSCVDNTGGGGGGHGGVGGNGWQGNAGGGIVGNAQAPVLLGSSGGGGSWGGCQPGSAGGNAIKINASGTITVSGAITSSGADAGTDRIGGGSGGSIWLIANILTGSANITAKGGNNSGAYGGTGGGGRISLNYRTSNTWAGTTSVNAGTPINQSNAGGVGSVSVNIVPLNPTSLAQYKSNGTTVIASGGTTTETSVVLKFSMSAASNLTLRPEVEVRDINTSFTNATTNTGSNVAYSGSPVTGSVTVTSLPDVSNYHWQARVCEVTSGVCSDWVANGGSPYDFRVFTNQSPNAPSSLGPTNLTDGSSSNNATPTFTFTLSDPDVSNTVYYTIDISTVSNYSTVIVEYVSPLAAQGSRSFTVGQLAGSGTYLAGSPGQTLANGSYYWRVKTTDNSGAISGWTEGRSGTPAFVIDTSSPPTNASNLSFSNATNANWTNIKPRFTWTIGTDSGGSGLLGYCVAVSQVNIGAGAPSDDPAVTGGVLQGLDDGVSQTFCPYIATGASLDLSTVSGLSLTSNKQFYISIKAVDTAGNIYAGSSGTYQNLLSFKYDGIAPTNVTYITTPGGTYSNMGDMFFSWPTSGGSAASDAESGLLGYQYSLNDTAHWTGTTTDTLTGLSIIPSAASLPFYFDATRDSTQMVVGTNIIYFRAVDTAGNTSSTSTYRTASITYGGDAPTFAVDAAVTVTPSTGTENSFGLSWTAATPATNRTISSYYWMVNTVPPATLQTMLDNPATYFQTTSTSVPVQALPAVVHGSNRVYVIAVDDLNNYSPSSYISAPFTLNTTAPDAPKNLAVSDASIKSASLWRASLAWGVPDYIGLGDLLYTIQRSSDGVTWATVGTTEGNAYVDTVSTSTRFYWRVGTQDSGGVGGASPTYSNAVTLIPKGSYTSAADLTSGPDVSNITTKKAKITWSTSRGSDSKIAYGTETGKYQDEEPSNSTQTSDHTINLINLSPGTTYYYLAKWTDEDGNTGVSAEKTFSTESAPIIKEAEVGSISITSAILNFTSVHASKVKVYYGKSTSFGGVQQLDTASSESSYSVIMSDLEDGTKYYYQLNTFDSEGSEYTGEIHSFTTLPRPRVTDIKLQQVAGTAETTILVTWKSNTSITSVVTVYPSSDPASARNIIDLTLKEGDHSQVVSSLLPATDYSLVVKGSDKLGNQATSAPITFTTASDTRPPSIINLKVIGGTVPPVGFAAGTINAQLVVTWDTDEPATSQVEYGEGTGSEYSSKSTEDGNLTTNHVVVISGLTPSQVYHLRAISLDTAKNDGRSIDTVTIAPKATRSALDLVVSNLSQIFGNLKIFGK